MRVRRIDIQRFKSLYDLTLRPVDLTVLFGPNNSGKTNIAEGVDFVGEVHRFGLELAMQRRGGYEAMAYRKVRRSRQAMQFNVIGRMTLPEVRNAFRGRSIQLSMSPRSVDVE